MSVHKKYVKCDLCRDDIYNLNYARYTSDNKFVCNYCDISIKESLKKASKWASKTTKKEGGA